MIVRITPLEQRNMTWAQVFAFQIGAHNLSGYHALARATESWTEPDGTVCFLVPNAK